MTEPTRVMAGQVWRARDTRLRYLVKSEDRETINIRQLDEDGEETGPTYYVDRPMFHSLYEPDSPDQRPEDRPLEPGDVVVLKSGGMRMTVLELTTFHSPDVPALVRCVWHDEVGKLRAEDIPLVCLQRFEA